MNTISMKFSCLLHMSQAMSFKELMKFNRKCCLNSQSINYSLVEQFKSLLVM